MKVLDEELFDFDLTNKDISADIIKQNTDKCCTHSHCEEDSKMTQKKNKKANKIADVNELEDLCQSKKQIKTQDSHNHCHSDNEHEHEHCESTQEIVVDLTHSDNNTHNHKHCVDDHQDDEHNHSRSNEGIIEIISYKIKNS